MLIFELIFVFFVIRFLLKSDAKLLQKPIYIQILRFIFAYCKLLKYSILAKQKFIYGRVRFI